ncbi:ABC transporter ATP-binding protein [Chelativorans sp. AA-79]|uniref:ABC transporter ATP-binding protein n=1 Tax=Chelativorans sp. AA-79 TaxID=3028735 RepID=UPI0023F7316C|nr:ABC transporter ATP-binding protein [Chelativorans sp. AA-79]WEX10445.1 ABC transporter ATP-binding protein [Chelativorans sp. AA-79]
MATNVVLQKVFKRYGDVAVIHGVDINIEPGEFVVFVGPSGCGKSTLLRMIAGLEPITGGDLVIDSERMNDVPPARRGIAMVFQSYALYPHMTVYKNLAFGLETIGMKKAEIDVRVRRAAEILQIGPLLQRKPKQLSGGQRQRVAIGRAITREPKIFLFDEPLSNLDAELRVQMRVEISRLHNDLGNTMIYVTHDQVEAMTMADKIVVLRAGVVEQVGAPLELYNRPRNKFVAGFIGSPKMNMLEAKLLRNAGEAGIEIGGARIGLGRDLNAGHEGDHVSFGIRPEHLALNESPGHVSIGEVTVDLIESLGNQTMVYATTADKQPITLALDGQRELFPGTKHAAWFDPARAHVFNGEERAL